MFDNEYRERAIDRKKIERIMKSDAKYIKKSYPKLNETSSNS